MARSTAVIFAVFTLVAACSTNDRDLDDERRADGGVTDSDSGAANGGKVGSKCEADKDCPDGMFCDEEIPNPVPVDGAPHGEIDLALFPGGSCSPLSLGPYDPEGGASCDFAANRGAQGCGKDGTCVVESSDPNVIVSCRASCEPSADESGCDRDGYTCDFGLHACIEGCRSDAECRVLSLDSDGDGSVDGVAYDTTSKAVCDDATARCTHEGGATVSGVSCNDSNDCESDGTCIRATSTLSGLSFPGGFCTKFGCDVEGRECVGENNACARLRSLSSPTSSAPACLTSCSVGAEPAADQMGADGHGDGCRAGYRCHYNAASGARNGVCVGGEYNAVKKNNIGDGCETDAECYSPFGYGRCLFLQIGGIVAPTGTCSIVDCNVPGLPKALCGDGNSCIGLHDDVTFCAHECASAADCAEGYACADDDQVTSTPDICYPACFTDAECRKGQACELLSTGIGQCVAMPG